jgi:hypothetical protein
MMCPLNIVVLMHCLCASLQWESRGALNEYGRYVEKAISALSLLLTVLEIELVS